MKRDLTKEEKRMSIEETQQLLSEIQSVCLKQEEELNNASLKIDSLQKMHSESSHMVEVAKMSLVLIHDLNNTLQIIVANLDFILLAQDASDEAVKYVENIRKAALSAVSRIRRLIPQSKEKLCQNYCNRPQCVD
ncbi:MAG: hypothetical protein WCO84_03700 [bacterium]